NIPSLSIETVMMVGILAAVGVLIQQGTGVSAMIGQVAVLCMVGIRILPSANRIANAFNDISYYEPSLAAVEQVLSKTEAEKEKPKAAPSREVTRVPFLHEIRFEHLSYRYPGTDTDILAGADLVIPKGASIGLIGPSGAGKSTTVDVLLGLLVPQAGKVTVDGADIRDNLPGWYDRIGYVPQMIYMLDDTIRANVAYGIAPEKIDDQKVWYALSQARIDGFVQDLPNGLDTGIGERGVRISGGQRQRLGIARALYHNPDVLIFDEATSALDSNTENGIMEAIDDFKGKKTIVIVAHRLTTIRNCDAVYRVEGGGFHPVSREELAVLLKKATAEEEKEKQAKKAKDEEGAPA
ncbi:MAG: ABC transporter ATP-binding protein, partial [Lachnospiraceae bacterium]